MMMMSAMPVIPQRELIGWPLFFIFSLLLHLLVLLLWPASSLSLAGQSSVTNLAVTLETGTAMRPATQAAPTPAAPPRQRTPIATAQPLRQMAAKPLEPAPISTAVAEATPPATHPRLTGNSLRFIGDSQSLALDPPAGESEADDDMISAQIRTRFADHFVYPLLAQRNGWEGEVLLAFHVASDGTLSDFQVIHSSGHALLDEAALASMRAIGRIEFSSGVVLHHTLELRMPVVYHLAQR